MHSKLFVLVAATAAMATAAPTSIAQEGIAGNDFLPGALPGDFLRRPHIPKPYVEIKNPKAPNELQPMVLDLVNHSTIYLNKILDFAATAGDKPTSEELVFYQRTTRRFAQEIKKVIEVPEWTDPRYGNIADTVTEHDYETKNIPRIDANHVPYVPVVNPNNPFDKLDYSYDTPMVQ